MTRKKFSYGQPLLRSLSVDSKLVCVDGSGAVQAADCVAGPSVTTIDNCENGVTPLSPEGVFNGYCNSGGTAFRFCTAGTSPEEDASNCRTGAGAS